MTRKNALFALSFIFSLFCTHSVAAAPAEKSFDAADYLKGREADGNHGSISAQLELGEIYWRGAGVPQDNVVAFRWFQKAANAGNAKAQYRVGTFLAQGIGRDPDIREAAKWFTKSAERGNPEAQYILGLAFGNGNGVPQDFVLAHKWLNLAAANTNGAEMRQIVVRDRDAVETKMTPQQLEEAQRMAREWKPAH